ncbi:hypothetical protein BM221_010146 [Beauveria bassiana]|uniref:Uncharacterized protein n=1 Tax=Beauveria bassiana TaxID=176275 RepID=A0A2N6N9P5_BEABA|nr:hypothetical protein BM221_010146 [Beauveria bassiana]
MTEPFDPSITKLDHPPLQVNNNNYVFQVVTKIDGIYTPISIVNQVPFNEGCWRKKDKLWVAERSLLIHKFLSNKDPAARCRLEAEKKSVLEVSRKSRFWFRYDQGAAKDARFLAKSITGRQQALRNPQRALNPYTTCGILDCLGQQALKERTSIEKFLKQPSIWAPNSLKSVVDPTSDFTIVVFDTSDLDNIKVGVIEMPPGCNGREDRRLVTMEEYCNAEFGRYTPMGQSVIKSIHNLPRLDDLTVLQLVWNTEELTNWANKHAALPKEPTSEAALAEKSLAEFKNISNFTPLALERCFPRDGNLTNFFEDKGLKIADDEIAGLILSWLYRPDLALVAVKDLTIERLIHGLRHQSLVPDNFSLSFSAWILIESTAEQREKLITVLKLQNERLETVYIADAPMDPADSAATRTLLIKSAEAQAEFLGEIRRAYDPLLKKVQCSSMYTGKQEYMLGGLDKISSEATDILRWMAAEYPCSTHESSIIGRAPSILSTTHTSSESGVDWYQKPDWYQTPDWYQKPESGVDWYQKPDWYQTPDWYQKPESGVDWYQKPDWYQTPDWYQKPDWYQDPSGQ